MQIMSDEKAENFAVFLSKKEARELCSFLTTATETPEKLTKRKSAGKTIAHKIADEMPIW